MGFAAVPDLPFSLKVIEGLRETVLLDVVPSCKDKNALHIVRMFEAGPV
jgi:hypothetical protein